MESCGRMTPRKVVLMPFTEADILHALALLLLIADVVPRAVARIREGLRPLTPRRRRRRRPTRKKPPRLE
jgi:hypothetical protein